MISVIAENSVSKDWVAEVKGLFRETHRRHKRTYYTYVCKMVMFWISLAAAVFPLVLRSRSSVIFH